MRVIVPKPVTDSVFISSTIAEADAAAYVAGTTYAADALVMYNHHVYKSLQAANTGNTPGLTTSATWWSDQGPTNRWKMFDDKIGTVSTDTTTFTVELNFGRCSGFALFGIDATTLTAEVRDSDDVVVWTETVDLTRDPLIVSWSDYFFEPVEAITEYVKTGLPLYSDSTLEFKVSKTSGTVGIGNCVIGRDRFIGLTQFGAEAGMTDWSKKTTDSFGNIYLAQGNWAKENKFDLHIENTQLDRIYSVLTGLRGTATVFVGDNTDAGFRSLTSWGYIADFRTVIPGPAMSTCTIEIQGLI